MKEVVELIKTYEDGMNENRLVGSKCGYCDKVSVPPRAICRVCRSDLMGFIDVRPEGRLITWTEILVAPPSHTQKVPYILGVVELDVDGQALMGTIKMPEGFNLKTGTRMFGKFDENEIGTRRLVWYC